MPCDGSHPNGFFTEFAPAGRGPIFKNAFPTLATKIAETLQNSFEACLVDVYVASRGGDDGVYPLLARVVAIFSRGWFIQRNYLLPAAGTQLALMEEVEEASTTSLPRARGTGEAATAAVSYTHLTLPTKA